MNIKRQITYFYKEMRKKYIVKKTRNLYGYLLDEYSRDILVTREKYLDSHDNTLFIKSLIKNEGDDITFRLFDNMPIGNGNIIGVYYKMDDAVEYSELLFNHTEYKNRFEMISFADFKIRQIKEDDIVIPFNADYDIRRFLNFTYGKGIKNVFVPKRRVMNGECGTQYLDVFDPVENEVIVNAGCLDCGTDIQMLEWGVQSQKDIFF